MKSILNLLKFPKGTLRNPNHPQKGSAIKVEPIRSRADVDRIKSNLWNRPRDYLLFVLGINTGFRANELLSLKVYKVRNLSAGDDLEIKLSKTRTYRRITINSGVVEAIGRYLSVSNAKDDDWLFRSKKSTSQLKVSTVSGYVKRWCRKAGLQGNYASHTLRKTWGYMQRKEVNTPIPLLMTAYGHSTQKQTLSYLCIQSEEIAGVYMSLVL